MRRAGTAGRSDEELLATLPSDEACERCTDVRPEDDFEPPLIALPPSLRLLDDFGADTPLPPPFECLATELEALATRSDDSSFEARPVGVAKDSGAPLDVASPLGVDKAAAVFAVSATEGISESAPLTSLGP